MRLAQTMACVVLLTAAVVHGRSIDNPAEDIPSPVQVSSTMLFVKGPNSQSEGRRGRTLTIDEDGIPVIEGVRSPDDNSPIHRNARIINNILVLSGDEAKFAQLNSVVVTSSDIHLSNSKPPASTLSQGDIELISKSALVTKSNYSDRQARVLNRSASKSTHSLNREGRFFPTDSNQVVSYSYFASPEDGSSSSSSQIFGSRPGPSKSVVYGTGVASKPIGVTSKNDIGFPISTSVTSSVSSSVSSSVNFVPSTKQSQTIDKGTFVKLKPSSILQNSQSLTDSKWSESSPIKQSFVQSNSIHSSPGHAVPRTPASARAVSHHSSAPQAPVYNHHQSRPAPAHAPSSHPIQANAGEFTIHQKTFQAHPGAPTFNIPIPIPTSQLPNQAQPIQFQQPIQQHQIQQHFEAQQQLHQPQPSAQQYAAASESFQKVTHQNPAAQYYETQHSVLPELSAYEKMMQPFKNIGSSVSKVFESMGASVRRSYSNLKIPARMSNIVSSVRKSSMNDYVQRTVSGENLPLVAGAVALGSLGLIAGAIAVSNANLTLGKRSIDDPAEEFLFQMVDSFVEPSIFDRLEEYTSWTDSQCSKRVFCDVMSLVSDDYIYIIEKRMGLFLNMLDHGREEEMSIKRSAADVMDAVRRRDCVRFTCGDQIDSVVIPKDSSGPR